MPIQATKPTTLHDVASLAGVSTQTVSRVVNNKPGVATSTRTRVLAATQALNYRPNAVARSLVSQRTLTLGIVSLPVGDYFQAQVVAGLEQAARERGYGSLISFTESAAPAVSQTVDSMLARRVDGLALLTPTSAAQRLDRLTIPCVTLASPILNPQAINVDVDNIDGAYQATRHLVEQGHQRVGIVSGPAGWKVSTDRIEGARRAMEEAGCLLDERLIEISDGWSLEAGYRAAQKLYNCHPDITALFCHNDWLALGAMRVLRERGVHAPEQISIVGYDDLPVCEYVHPALTSVRQPKTSLGQRLAHLLIDAIEHEPSSVNQSLGRAPQDILVQAELHVRGSVAAPRG